MYILIIASSYPTEKYVGNSIFEFEQAKALSKAGHKVIFTVIDLRSVRRWRKWGFESIEKDGMEVWAINIPCGRFPKRLLYKIGILGLKSLYKKICKLHGVPDAVHAHFGSMGFIATEVFKARKIPIVITEHSSHVVAKKLTNYEVSCLKSCVGQSDAFLCVGNALKKSVMEITNTNKDIMVVPNMVSPLFQYKKKEIQAKEFIFLSIGSLIERKRFALTIEAFTKAFKGNEDIRLNIIGSGPLHDELQKYIEKLNMNNQISLLGQMTRQEVAEKMQECDVFVLVSECETFGVVYIEALACGKPVIGSRNGGADDIINSKNGIIVNVDDCVQITNAMKKMYDSSSEYNNEDISLDCLSRYSEKALTDNLTSIYTNLCKPKGTKSIHIIENAD